MRYAFLSSGLDNPYDILIVRVVDSDSFKGVGELEQLEARTRAHLEHLGKDLLGQYPKVLVVAGQIIFDEDTAWNRLLHNETAFIIQRRLQHVAVPMVVLPVQLNLSAVGTERTVRRPLATEQAA